MLRSQIAWQRWQRHLCHDWSACIKTYGQLCECVRSDTYRQSLTEIHFARKHACTQLLTSFLELDQRSDVVAQEKERKEDTTPFNVSFDERSDQHAGLPNTLLLNAMASNPISHDISMHLGAGMSAGKCVQPLSCLCFPTSNHSCYSAMSYKFALISTPSLTRDQRSP